MKRIMNIKADTHKERMHQLLKFCDEHKDLHVASIEEGSEIEVWIAEEKDLDNSICLIPEERNNVLAMAKSCRLDCFYDNDEHAAPEFRAKLPSLSFCLNSNIERIIDKIEEFLNKLIVFNWKAYKEFDNR